LLAALWQLRQGVLDGRARDEDRRVERALDLYESLVAQGATYEGFHRLSIFLRRLGTHERGITTWHVVSDGDLDAGGCLDPAEREREQPFADLYAVLWFFERCKTALDRSLVSEDVLMSTVGFHFWWWGQILRDLRGPKATAAVHELAAKATTWAATNKELSDWQACCRTDFDGGPQRSALEPTGRSTVRAVQ
jgi:hypothetical protein